jgi:hypothetical protein
VSSASGPGAGCPWREGGGGRGVVVGSRSGLSDVAVFRVWQMVAWVRESCPGCHPGPTSVSSVGHQLVEDPGSGGVVGPTALSQ